MRSSYTYTRATHRYHVALFDACATHRYHDALFDACAADCYYDAPSDIHANLDAFARDRTGSRASSRGP
jgi:hypothetical protein